MKYKRLMLSRPIHVDADMHRYLAESVYQLMPVGGKIIKMASKASPSSRRRSMNSSKTTIKRRPSSMKPSKIYRLFKMKIPDLLSKMNCSPKRSNNCSKQKPNVLPALVSGKHCCSLLSVWCCSGSSLPGSSASDYAAVNATAVFLCKRTGDWVDK